MVKMIIIIVNGDDAYTVMRCDKLIPRTPASTYAYSDDDTVEAWTEAEAEAKTKTEADAEAEPKADDDKYSNYSNKTISMMIITVIITMTVRNLRRWWYKANNFI